ncbi:MAG TPA: type IV secretory system conjugative DNA transfer family protein [Clostridium sp.]|nr:type IV secretory system conjugative DNA transfer family protein [Clostridium sp.]
MSEKIYYEPEDAHTLIIGTTRSGKSRKIILPSIWTIAQSGESMVLGDPKGELYIMTREYLKKMGYEIIVLNLRTPSMGNQWNMLDMVIQAVDKGDISKATEIAWDIASAIVNQKPSNGEPIWQNGEESTIAALILAVCMEADFRFQKHMASVYYLLAEYGIPLEDETVPLNEYFNKLPATHPAKGAFATARIAPLKTRGSFFTTALADLRLFSDPNIADMCSKMDHNLKDIGIRKTAVFLIVPDEKVTRNVLATLYIDQLYTTLVELANESGGRIPRRVNFIIDEFGNLPPIPQFDKKLTVAGGRGMRFNMAVQDFAQLEKLYGKNDKTIRGNCHNWIYILTSDPETAKVVSERTGQYTVQTESANSSLQAKGGGSFGSGASLTGRALFMPDEIMRWPDGRSLVLRVRKNAAVFAAPDLTKYKANEDFGFTLDKTHNQNVIKERWDNTPVRKIEETQIWLPEINKGVMAETKTEVLTNTKETFSNDEEDFL